MELFGDHYRIVSCFFCLYTTISFITSFVIGNPHATTGGIGLPKKPILVRGNLRDVDVFAIIRNLSKEYKIVVSMFHFLCFSFVL